MAFRRLGAVVREHFARSHARGACALPRLSASSRPGAMRAGGVLAAATSGAALFATCKAHSSSTSCEVDLNEVPKTGPPLSVPTFDVTGKHFIVTGGTQGLGLEIARRLKTTGAAKIVIMSRTRSKGEVVAKELTGRGCTVYFVEADMSDPASVQRGAAKAIETLGGHVDGLVNAAGLTERGNLMTTTAEGFDKQFAVNTRAPFLMTQAVAKSMIDKNVRGAVVNISSIASKGGAPFIMAYSASKGALNILSANNAAELAPHGIRLNTVAMGWTFTENENAMMAARDPNWLEKADASIPLGRLLRCADVACTVCFLLSPASQMMTGNVVSLHPETAVGMLSLLTEDSLDR